MNSKEWQKAKLRSMKPGETIIIESSVFDMLSSAELARIRLNGVVRQDRKACGDGKWVKRGREDFSVFALRYGVNILWGGPPVLYRGKPITFEAMASLLKPRYRWQWRH